MNNNTHRKDRRMGFHEINGGKLAEEVQKRFEDAQDVSSQREVKVKVCLEITVFPPDHNEESLGYVSYKCHTKEPAFESRKLDTLLKDGRIIQDAENPQKLLNLDLFDADNPNKIPFNQNQKEA